MVLDKIHRPLILSFQSASISHVSVKTHYFETSKMGKLSFLVTSSLIFDAANANNFEVTSCNDSVTGVSDRMAGTCIIGAACVD